MVDECGFDVDEGALESDSSLSKWHRAEDVLLTILSEKGHPFHRYNDEELAMLQTVCAAYSDLIHRDLKRVRSAIRKRTKGGCS